MKERPGLCAVGKIVLRQARLTEVDWKTEVEVHN